MTGSFALVQASKQAGAPLPSGEICMTHDSMRRTPPPKCSSARAVGFSPAAGQVFLPRTAGAAAAVIVAAGGGAPSGLSGGEKRRGEEKEKREKEEREEEERGGIKEENRRGKRRREERGGRGRERRGGDRRGKENCHAFNCKPARPMVIRLMPSPPPE